MPKVSVILTVFNGADTLPDCLRSIASQTLRDIEIICVNDGSTDSSLTVLNGFAAGDSRIRIVDQPNAGAGAARNVGLALAEGEYLSFLDADDFYEPTMLEAAYQRAQEANADIVVFGCDMVQGGAHFPCDYSIQKKLLPAQPVFSGRDVPKDVFRLFVGWAWDKLFKASFVREHGLKFQQQRTTNDMLFVFSALVCSERICVYDNVLAHHTVATGSISTTREKSWQCFYQALLALRDQLKKWDLYDRFEQDYLNYCIHFSLWNLNTLKEPVRTQLAEILRTEWFAELGVTKYPQSFFYNRYEYNCYLKLMDSDYGHDNLWSRSWRCLREHGIGYTVKYALKKLR